MKWFRRKSPQERAERKALKQRQRRFGKFLTITPPEGVPLSLRLAGSGQRMGAQIIDFVLTIMCALLIVYSAAYALGGLGYLFFIILSLTFFLIRIPYYVITELAWNGRTLAKRFMRMRVVSTDGRSLSAYQVVARNLMREVEFFAPLIYLIVGAEIHLSVFFIALGWTIIVITVIVRSKKTQRIGDIIAGTAVVIDPRPALLPDIAVDEGVAATRQDRFLFASEHLEHYGAFELQTLERVLRARPAKNRKDVERQARSLADIVNRITKKIGYVDPVEAHAHKDFLQAFYTAQRGYLESRKLLGDARADKNFREQKEEA